MNGALLLAIVIACFAAGYFLYSRRLARMLGVDPSRPTPAHAKRDGVDFVPAHPMVLFGHHFATIAGAGPIVGPVLAAQFGWLPVVLWVVFGCIFIGAAHDMIAMFLSVRHGGESIGSVIGTVLGRGGKTLFLLFSWSALVLVVAEFTRQVAGTFVAEPGVATASLLFMVEAVAFGLCVNRLRISVLAASIVFVPLMFAFVWIGSLVPLDLVKYGLDGETARAVWTVVLLVYCFVASTCPVWLLLQPRDYLNSYLLYAMMALGFLGVFVAHPQLSTDVFAGFAVAGRGGAVEWLFPFLFVTVACGACSGFHALVASGTSAKQLDSEKSIRPVAYGGMLLEGVLATIAIVGVAGTYAGQAAYSDAIKGMEPVQMFANSIAGFCVGAGIPLRAAESFMLLSVSAFLMTTIDSSTRLARFSLQELVGAGGGSERGAAPGAVARIVGNMYFAAFAVVALVACLLLGAPKTSKHLWTIFASANQLLAALTLLAATLWFVRNRKPCLATAIPMVFMFCVSSIALGMLSWKSFNSESPDLVKGCATLFLLVLAAILAVLAARSVRRDLASRRSA